MPHESSDAQSTPMDHSQMDHGTMDMNAKAVDRHTGHNMELDLPVNAPAAARSI